jgi:hypothetical protein
MQRIASTPSGWSCSENKDASEGEGVQYICTNNYHSRDVPEKNLGPVMYCVVIGRPHLR